MINIFKMFTIGPRYSFGCPAVFALAYCGVLRCSAVFRHTASISIIRMMIDETEVCNRVTVV